MAGLELRLSEGRARLGRTSVEVALADEPGALRIGGADGMVLRPLSFGERDRLVRYAAAAPQPLAELAALVTAASRESETEVLEAAIVDCLALHLAGAKSGGFGFAAEASLLARALGWSPRQIAEAEASEIDALAVQWRDAEAADEAAGGRDDGWTRVVLTTTPDTAAPASDSPAELREALAQDLLDRGREGLDLSLLGPPPAQSPLPVAEAWRETTADTMQPRTAEAIFPGSTGLPRLSREDSRPTAPDGLPDIPTTPESGRAASGQTAQPSSTAGVGSDAAPSPSPDPSSGSDPTPPRMAADAAPSQAWSTGDLVATFFEGRDGRQSQHRDTSFVAAPFDPSYAAVIPFPGLASDPLSRGALMAPGDPGERVALGRADAFEEPYPARSASGRGRLSATSEAEAAAPPQAPRSMLADQTEALADALHRIADLRGIEP